MKRHEHWCSECDVEWECYDNECAGVTAMHCDGCAYEADAEVLETATLLDYLALPLPQP